MIIAIPVTPDGAVEERWAGPRGSRSPPWWTDASRTGRSTPSAGTSPTTRGTEGAHHARVVRFLRENGVTHVVVDHMGAGMRHTLGKLGIEILPVRSPFAREAVVLAVASLR
jgi:Dinitrogenase iron-molybdenum cofactor.